MIRLSVSWLDEFLYWQSQEDMSVEDLISRLKGVPEPTPQMLAGRAFHSLLEHSGIGEVFAVHHEGFTFEFNVEADIEFSPIVELKGEHAIDTPSGKVTLVGKVDAMNGRLIRDYKLTERFDAERYADSYQWRAYLMMFEGRAFIYDVFSGRVDESVVKIFGYDKLPLYAYPGMEQDVIRVVSELAGVVARYWPERIAA